MSVVKRTIDTADIITKQIVEMIEAIFHIEDIFTLAKGNSFIAMNFLQLICNLDYVIFTPTDMSPAGSDATGLIGAAENVLGIGGKSFKLSPEGKLAAIAECFRIQANKMDTMITIDQATAFLQGTGAAQIAQDAINAFLKGGGQITSALAQAAPVLAAGASLDPQVAAIRSKYDVGIHKLKKGEQVA